MPFKAKPTCVHCSVKVSNLWRKGPGDKVYCVKCARKELDGEEGSETGSVNSNSPVPTKSEWCSMPAAQITSTRSSLKDSSNSSQFSGPLRKSARIKPSKYKFQPGFKHLPTKGKSRRPIKSPSPVATVITSEYVFHEGQYWQTGDIASVMDDDGGIFYVQMRGFLQDQYCDKSAVITWVLPTTASVPGKFDPATYIIGPEEDLPRALSCFEFIMHAPSGYFYDKNAPYQTKDEGPQLGYVWTRLGPEIRRIPNSDQIYGLEEMDTDIPASPPQEKVKAKPDNERKRKRNGKRKIAAAATALAAKRKSVVTPGSATTTSATTTTTATAAPTTVTTTAKVAVKPKLKNPPTKVDVGKKDNVKPVSPVKEVVLVKDPQPVTGKEPVAGSIALGRRRRGERGRGRPSKDSS